MKKLLLFCLAIVACTGSSRSSSDTTHYGAPPMKDSVVAKVPPDTLVNGMGEKCVVRPSAKYDGVMIGESYENCDWR